MAELTHRTHQAHIITAVLPFAAILPPRLAPQSPSPGFLSMSPDPLATDFARRGAAGSYT
jgi:hypothetical protein